MKISTKGIYAVRFMIFLAQQDSTDPVPLKTVANGTGISRKYLEQIVSSLTAVQLVKSSRGASGGYRLAKSASRISMFDILSATEGSLAPVDYSDEINEGLSQQGACFEMFMWRDLHEVIKDYLEGVSLQDIIDRSTQLQIDSYSI